MSRSRVCVLNLVLNLVLEHAAHLDLDLLCILDVSSLARSTAVVLNLVGWEKGVATWY